MLRILKNWVGLFTSTFSSTECILCIISVQICPLLTVCSFRSSSASNSSFYLFEAVGARTRCGLKLLIGPEHISSVQRCRPVTASAVTSVNSPPVTGVHTLLLLLLLLVVGLGDPVSFMYSNLSSSHWGKTLNDPLKHLTAAALLLSFLFICNTILFLGGSQLVSLFLVFLLIFLFLIKPKVPSKWFIRCFSAHLLHHSL